MITTLIEDQTSSLPKQTHTHTHTRIHAWRRKQITQDQARARKELASRAMGARKAYQQLVASRRQAEEAILAEDRASTNFRTKDKDIRHLRDKSQLAGEALAAARKVYVEADAAGYVCSCLPACVCVCVYVHARAQRACVSSYLRVRACVRACVPARACFLLRTWDSLRRWRCVYPRRVGLLISGLAGF